PGGIPFSRGVAPGLRKVTGGCYVSPPLRRPSTRWQRLGRSPLASGQGLSPNEREGQPRPRSQGGEYQMTPSVPPKHRGSLELLRRRGAPSACLRRVL